MSYSGWLGPRLRTEWVEGTQQLRLLPRRSWKLVGVTVALFALHDINGFSHIHRPRNWFDDVVIAVITILLVALLVAIVGEFLGTETVGVVRGDLVISRGIGPLRRTFRYRVTDMAELTSIDPSLDEKGKRHIHHIFARPKTGAVRFEYGDKAVHFADWLDESEGEQIVSWLKPRLPGSAIAPLPPQYGGTASLRL